MRALVLALLLVGCSASTAPEAQPEPEMACDTLPTGLTISPLPEGVEPPCISTTSAT